MSEKRTTVHIRVNDVATGKPTPVRIRFTDLEGNHHAPLGHRTNFATGPNLDVGGNVSVGFKPYAYIDGTCEVTLPPGLLHVEIEKGPEYLPVRTEIQQLAGKLSMRFQIERWIDQRARSWYSGDTCVHFLSPHAALLEAQAEDVAVVNLLIKQAEVVDGYRNTFPAYPNLTAFSGQNYILSVPGYGVAVNSFNQHPDLGSLGLLHSHRVVYPLNFGGPQGTEDWNLAAWCDQCHRKNGLVIWSGPKGRDSSRNCGEPLADLLLGKIDAFELDFWENSPHDLLADYYTLLDVGCVIPLVGASGKDSNATVLGVMRTYAHLETEWAYGPWIEAVRAGRTFVTNGPMLEFSVNGIEPTNLPLNVTPGERVKIRAEARSRIPFDQLEIVFNGEVIAEATPSSDILCEARLEVEHEVKAGGWLAARCRGSYEILDRPQNQRVFAHTSPIYLTCQEAPMPIRAEVVEYLLADLDEMLAWTREKARCETVHQRESLANIFFNAREVLVRRAL